MELEKLAQGNPVLQQLLRQASYFQRLDNQIKRLFPLNLADFFKVVCIQDNRLILSVQNPTVASRLKMLLPAVLSQIKDLDERIGDVVLNVQPIYPPKKPPKRCVMDKQVIDILEESLNLFEHKPKIADSLVRLIERRKQGL